MASAGEVRAGGVDGIGSRAEFAAQLDALRHAAGTSVRALAQAVDTPPSTIGGWTSGRHLPNVRQIPLLVAVLRELGVDDAAQDQWVAALQRVRAAPGPRPSTADVPYRGLEPFSEDDASWFFGRGALLDQLFARLGQFHRGEAGDRPQLLILVGGSGTGKSSLLRAGLMAGIGTGLPGARYRPVYVTPGADASDTIARIAAAGGEPTLLVVDQFEELFTHVGDQDARTAFVDALVERARHDPVVIALRSDFYGHLTSFPAMAPALETGQIIVPPLGPEALETIILEPARRAGVGVEAPLVERLMRDFAPSSATGSTRATLPLLSHALLETWQRRRRGTMALADYLEAGGLEGAVEQTAEEAYGALAPAQQSVAHRLFLRLVNVDPDGVTTRRRLARADMTAAATDAERADLEHVADHFVARRLLASHDDAIELCHEALIGAWPRLRQWIDADREGLLMLGGLRDSVKAWSDHPDDATTLVGGGRLEQLVAWTERGRGRAVLTPAEEAYLAASRRHQEDQIRAGRRRRHQLVAVSAVAGAMAVLASGFAAYALGQKSDADAARRVASSRRLALESRRAGARDASVAAQLAAVAYATDPTDDAYSALLDATSGPVAQRLVGEQGSTALASAPGAGTVAVSHAKDGTIHLVDVSTGTLSPAVTVPAVAGAVDYFGMAMSADGSWLAAGGTNGAVSLWALAPGGARLVDGALGSLGASVQAVAISPDGTQLVAGGATGQVLRWRLAPGAAPEAMPPFDLPKTAAGKDRVVKAVALSADGQRLATGSDDGIVRVWSIGTSPALTAEWAPEVDTDQVHAVAFDPVHGRLAAGYRSGAVRVADVDTAGALREVDGVAIKLRSWTNALAFSADGTLLAAGGSDSDVGLWRTTDWSTRLAVTAPAPVTGITFDRTGTHVLAVSNDGALRSWPLGGPPLVGPRGKIFSIAYDDTGSRMAVFPGAPDGTAELWDTSHPDAVVPVELALAPAGDVKLSGSGAINRAGTVVASGTTTGALQLWRVDGATVRALPAVAGATDLVEMVAAGPHDLFAAAADDGSVPIWDVSDIDHPRLRARLTDGPGLKLGVAFNADGTLLAAASADHSVYLWDVHDPDRPALVNHLTGFENYAYSVAFSDDGTLLAAGSADATTRVWDITTPSAPVALGAAITGPQNYVYSLAFRKGTRLLAAGVTDGTVWLWDLAHPARPRHVATLNVARAAVFAVAFQADTDVLSAGGTDLTVFRWNLDPQRARRQACAASGTFLSEAEWNRFLPDQAYVARCPAA